MLEKFKALVFSYFWIFFSCVLNFSTFLNSYAYAHLDLNKITQEWVDNQKEQKYLELFLHTFFLEGDFSYTLFGAKPMSFSGVTRNCSEPIEKISHLLLFSDHLSLWRAVEIFKKYRKCLDKNYFFIFNQTSCGTFIYFIHKTAFLETIDKNIDVFLKELGEDFTPEFFLSEILEEKKPLLEMIHYHEGILGILLGYGRHNSLLFQKKADILGKCWGYDQDIRKSSSVYLSPIDSGSTLAELSYLDSKLEPFSEEWEYCPLIPIGPLGFGVDNDHPETKKLREKYTALRGKINIEYSKSNLFEVILKMLGIFDLHSHSSEA